MIETLPQRLLSWYGDDFTGSTDVLEMLSLNSIPAVLFLSQPDDALFARFADYRAFGLAGISRSQSPEWMDEHLPAVFDWLAGIHTPIVHYKVCSTFDSSPQTGSIGRALEIGQRIISPTSPVPIVVGAPALRRYTAFGHLFAGVSEGAVYRIDRHPTMSRHPVTPMREADLREHLSRQTSTPIHLISFVDLERGAELPIAPETAVLIDVLDDATLRAAGKLLWTAATNRPLFVIGSSGVEHALSAHWQCAHQQTHSKVAPADRIVVLSGSCSPVTARQIEAAASNGMTMIALDAKALASGDGRTHQMESAIANASKALSGGNSTVLYSAAGDGTHLAPEDLDRPGFRESLARSSGEILRSVLDQTGVRRVIVAGGDTSSHTGSLLDIQALTFIASLAPGAPLCQAWSHNPRRDGIEIVFKGGQCGNSNFFLQAKG